MTNLLDARAAFETAETDYNRAYRRAQWLEARMMGATDDDTYNNYARQLEEQETVLKYLGVELMRARAAFVGEELRARYGDGFVCVRREVDVSTCEREPNRFERAAGGLL